MRHGSGFLRVNWFPLMRSVRRLPEYKALMREFGLVDYWREAGWPEHCAPLGADDFVCS
jgi:hypothetical protein